MIGRYLRGLPTETLQAILETRMSMGSLSGPCLVGVDYRIRGENQSLDYAAKFARGWATILMMRKYFPDRKNGHYREKQFTFSIQLRFDGLCEKYGVDKVSAAIRFKVLNILSERMPHNEPQGVVMAGVPVEV